MRENYEKLMKNNAKLKIVSVIPLTDKQTAGFKRFCLRNCIASGNDNVNHFFIPSGLFSYHVDFIKTSNSGRFAKIRKNYLEIF